MADDTRLPDAQPPPQPKGPANTMPGGSAHTAGGTSADAGPTYTDVVRSLGPEYYLNFYKRPCVRDSQLVGIGAGFVGGSVAAIARRPVSTASNIAVLTWTVASCASYQYCQYWRSKEKKGMQMAQQLMEKKRERIAAKQELRRKQREEYEREEEAKRIEEQKRKSWSYWANKKLKFW